MKNSRYREFPVPVRHTLTCNQWRWWILHFVVKVKLGMLSVKRDCVGKIASFNDMYKTDIWWHKSKIIWLKNFRKQWWLFPILLPMWLHWLTILSLFPWLVHSPHTQNTCYATLWLVSFSLLLASISEYLDDTDYFGRSDILLRGWCLPMKTRYTILLASIFRPNY